MAADHVEVLAPDVDLAGRFPGLAPLAKGAGWAVYAGPAHGAWWIVFDDAGLEDADDPGVPVVRAERYDDRARWSAACRRIADGELT